MFLEDVDRQEAARLSSEARKRASDAITHKGRAKDRRQPGECRRPQDAITSFCSECITMYGLDTGGHGSILNAIRGCTAKECHLWPWRTGKLVVDEEGNIK
jgi:hypothetical protein